MKRFLCLATALALAFTGSTVALAEESSVDYSMAEKLLKQLDAGSGFSGTLQVESKANEAHGLGGVTTKQPLQFQWDYIHVREDGLIQEEQRVDLALMEEEEVKSTVHFQWKDMVLSFQADLLSPDWFRLSQPMVREDGGAEATMDDALGDEMSTLLAENGIPDTISGFLPILLGCTRENEALEPVLERFLTRMDIWIEGYRESTVMGKLEDGTGTMALRYVIAPTNIKAQLKQLVMDLLSDASIIARLEEHFGAENVSLYLNPEWEAYYFAVIDDLPLTGDLTIERTVSLKGDTLSLALSLPYYDSASGDVTLRYTRSKGDGELPDNEISLESQRRVIRFSYLEYSSMTDVTVIQGSYTNEPTQEADFAVADEGAATALPQKALSLAFTLRSQTNESMDAEDREVYHCHYELTLTPEGESVEQFQDMEIVLDAEFASKTLRKAATDVNGVLTLGGEQQPQQITLTFAGRTRAAWTPADVPGDARSLNALPQEEWGELSQRALVNAGSMLVDYIDLVALLGGAAEPTETDAPSPSSQEEPTDAPVETEAPVEEENPAPEETAAIAPEETSKGLFWLGW